ncbi:MAG: hypothetical protein WA979_13655 [Pacificimonas sp.]
MAALIELSAAMAAEGRMLLQRVVPDDPAAFRQWDHYPEDDAIDPASGARWFYHAHPPEERAAGEHGHFHIFLPLSAFDHDALAGPDDEDAAQVVHVAALAFDVSGMPTGWLATNRWVTNEHLQPAGDIIARLDALRLDRAGAESHPGIGRWLSLALTCCRADIESMLRERDRALAACDSEDRNYEILAQRPFVLE